MSRIAGIHSPQSNFDICSKMLASVNTDASWSINIEDDKACTIGSIGKYNSNFSGNGISIVLDGIVYNHFAIDKVNPIGATIFNLYKRYGFEGMVKRLNGDFAIALYDSGDQTLWIARDRVGVKPLYYSIKNGEFAFASRPKSLLQLDYITNKPNTRFVGRFAGGHYRYIDNVPQESPFEDIEQLTAAHILCYKNNNIKKLCYWKLEEKENWISSEKQLAEEYRSLLFDAVNLRYATADKPAFTLSGGMDSSSVLASVVKLTGIKQHAFSSVYIDKTYDESDEISSMLESSVEKWHKVVLDNTPDVFTNIRRMIQANDEPVATATWLSHFLLCEEVKKEGFGSLFGGLGGDELNAGEYEHFFFHFADLLKSEKKEVFLQEIQKWGEYHDHPIFKKNLAVAEESINQLIDIYHPGICFPDLKRMRKYGYTVNKDFFNFAKFDPIMVHPFSSYLKNRTYQDIFFETAPCCLRAEDRHTLAFGLDNFVPFFDYRLLEFMFQMPGDFKIRGGVTKILLREAMDGVLPDETRGRIKKTGWNAPAHMWFSGKGLEELQDIVHSHQFLQRGIYNIREVINIISEHKEIVTTGAIKDNHMMFLWQLVNLELWMSSLQ